jgi:tripartite-type tricarboxylate transporter receptor subunit TctC
MTRSLALILLLASACIARAQADALADFYRGKQIKIIIRTAAGTGYDVYSRLLARHIVRHIPGRPALMLPVNMEGAGGIVAANYMAEVAPKDGTVIAMLNQGIIADQALGINKTLKTDLRTFNWLGIMSGSNDVLATWHSSPTKTLADAMRRETLVGATGAGSVSTQMPAVYNNILGTRFKIVIGYANGGEINLAMERGEIEGKATNPYSSYVAATNYVRDHLINIIIQTGVKKDPAMPDVPLLRDLGKTAQDTAILDFISNSVAIGWPIATNPGVPAPRVAALRRAFDETLRDPEFLADAARQKVDISPTSGLEAQQMIDAVIGAPSHIKEEAKRAMEPKSDEQVKRAAGK